jgi:hypothetical protein
LNNVPLDIYKFILHFVLEVINRLQNRKKIIFNQDDSVTEGHIFSFSYDVICNILHHTDPISILNFGSTCKKYYNTVSDFHVKLCDVPELSMELVNGNLFNSLKSLSTYKLTRKPLTNGCIVHTIEYPKDTEVEISMKNFLMKKFLTKGKTEVNDPRILIMKKSIFYSLSYKDGETTISSVKKIGEDGIVNLFNV